jgi:hypothetical protein
MTTSRSISVSSRDEIASRSTSGLPCPATGLKIKLTLRFIMNKFDICDANKAKAVIYSPLHSCDLLKAAVRDRRFSLSHYVPDNLRGRLNIMYETA